MLEVVAEFDGNVFVPQEPVNLPVGTRVAVSIPDLFPKVPTRQFTAEEDRDWERMLAQIREGDPDPPTVEEAMDEIRMRP